MLADIRGWRNNNPGNIRNGPKWNGLRAIQTDPDFSQFTSPEFGIRALAKLLVNYQTKYRTTTIRLIIERYAPGVENDTEAYVQYVSRMVSTKPDLGYRLTNKTLLADLVMAIISFECGVQPYSREIIMRGVNLAWNQ